VKPTKEIIMTNYVDIFVAPVPKKNIDAYRKEAELFFQVFRENGALSCVEVEGDDVPVGKVTSFPRSLELKDDETVFVGIITFRDRAHRDEANAKAMKDPRLAGMDPKTMSFDAMRMYYGGFKPFVGQAITAPAVQPYLFFRGRCEEAIEYYKEKLGAEIVMKMRFKDSPEKPDPDKVPPALDDKIMHAAIRIHGAEIMMSDGMRTGPLDFQCMSLSLSVPNETEAERVFHALAEEGTVQMPMMKTFFSPRFGSVADKFGVSWMVIVPQDQPS
jgi:PhnB protein